MYIYLFYKLYDWARRLNKDSTPEYTAFFSTVALTFFNFLFVWWGISNYLNWDNLFARLGNFQIIGIGLVVALPQFFILIYNNKHEEIYEKYKENETKQKSTLGSILVTLYIMLTFASLYVIAFKPAPLGHICNVAAFYVWHL